MKYILIFHLLVSNSVFSQHKKIEKLLNNYVNVDKDYFNNQDSFSDTLLTFSKYHYFDTKALKNAANNYKHDFKEELYTHKDFDFFLNQIKDTSNAIINSKNIRPLRIIGKNENKRYVRFTKPLFYPHKKKVIVSYWYENCYKCSQGRTVLLEKNHGQWDIKSELAMYIE